MVNLKIIQLRNFFNNMTMDLLVMYPKLIRMKVMYPRNLQLDSKKKLEEVISSIRPGSPNYSHSFFFIT